MEFHELTEEEIRRLSDEELRRAWLESDGTDEALADELERRHLDL